MDTQIFNHWTDLNTNTIKTWKDMVARMLFVYHFIMDMYQRKLNRILVASLILSSIATVLSAVSTLSLTTNEAIYLYIALAINICVTILSAWITILGGVIKIYKLDEIVSSYVSYINKLDIFYLSVSQQLLLPPSLREDAILFIQRENNTYNEIIKQSPSIDMSEQINALKEYQKYLNDKTLHPCPYDNDIIIYI